MILQIDMCNGDALIDTLFIAFAGSAQDGNKELDEVDLSGILHDTGEVSVLWEVTIPLCW